MNQLKYTPPFTLLIMISSFFLNAVLADEIISEQSNKQNINLNAEVTEILQSKIALDDRNSFNSKSIYFELNDKAFVIFEDINDYDSSKIGLVVAPIDISINHQDTKNKENKTQSIPLIFEDKISNKNYQSLTGIVQTKGENWLYFTVSEGFRSDAKIMKGRLTHELKVEDITIINIDTKLAGRSWPEINYISEKYYLVYRKAKCCGLSYAMSDDGINFSEIDSLGNTGAMPAINHFSDGKILYNYQRPYPTDKFTSKGKVRYVTKSRFKISDNDGLSWGPENIVTDTSYEVHDAFPFQREDGNIDMYYSHGLNRKGPYWSLWRRCVNSDGKLGKEQMLTNELIGDTTKPNAFRRNDGTIALLFIEQGENIKNGSIQYFSMLKKDAICQI